MTVRKGILIVTKTSENQEIKDNQEKGEGNQKQGI